MRKKGVFGQIWYFIVMFIILGLLVAGLRVFNWDIVEAGQFILSKIFEIIGSIADKFTQMPGFRQLFR